MRPKDGECVTIRARMTLRTYTRVLRTRDARQLAASSSSWRWQAR